VAANLRLGCNGFLFQVCCFQTQLRALLNIIIQYIWIAVDFRKVLEIKSEVIPNWRVSRDAAHSGSSSAPMPASDELVDDNMLLS